MIGSELVNYSLRNLWTRKSRSFLTILSIFVGITTIFIFISFGLGLQDYVNNLKTSSSADKLMIQGKGGGAPGLDSTFALNDDDLKAIQKTAGVYKASGSYINPAEAKQKDKLIYTFVVSYDPKQPILMELYDLGIEKGRLLRSGDTKKVVLGYNYLVPDKIFSKTYDINDNIEVEGQKLKVVGFMKSVGSPPDDSQIYITNGFVDKLFPNKNNSYGIIVAKVDVDNIDKVSDRIEKNLRKERGLDEGKEDFYVQSFDDLIGQFSGAINMINIFVIFIALISVVVSAINTANTMITSVIERTKEIGVMKSIGAKNFEILKIFLFESSVLGFFAGGLGVFMGWAVSSIAGDVLAKLGWSFLSPHFSTSLFVGLILFATITGGISGVIPAYNASKTNVVDALRYE